MKKITTMIFAVLFTANLIAQVPNYVPTNGLVGWWPFNGNANDESGNGNNGTVNGATLTTDRFGNVNKSYNFDGNDDIVIPAISQNSNWTICFWFYSNNLSSFGLQYPMGIGCNSFSNIGAPGFGINGGSQQSPCLSLELNKMFLTDAATVCTSNIWTPIIYQQLFWYHISISKVGNIYEIFVNGQKLVVGNLLQMDFNSIVLGRRCDINWLQFVGKIDDLGIWNRALTQSEITNLYTGCIKTINITPQNNQVNIGNTATFTANTAATSPTYIWQSDFGQGFQTLNSIGKYSGTSTNTMSVSNVQLSNHMEPIRAISVSGNCRDTSNIAYVKITDTCITKINDTIKITKYDTIKVMDTLVINATLSGISAPNNTNRIIVYPNPAKDHITIDYGIFSRMNGYTLKIVNTLGQTVFSSPINQQSSFINLSSWTGKGVYYLQIIDKQNSIIENRKIILQ